MLSKSALIPQALRGKPADVLVVLMKGRELGLQPMQALGEINCIQGRAVVSAALKVGLCVKDRSCVYFRLVSSDGRQATYETQRKGSEPVKLTWTLQQAQTAGLLQKDNWKAHPEAMLRARCSSALATAAYPDLVLGLDTKDEVEDRVDGIIQSPERDVTPAKPRAEELRERAKAALSAWGAPTESVDAKDLEAAGAAVVEPEQPEKRADVPLSDFSDEEAAQIREDEALRFPFGRDKGQPLSEVNEESLSFAVDTLGKSIADPAKARYRADNEKLRAACARELARRK